MKAFIKTLFNLVMVFTLAAGSFMLPVTRHATASAWDYEVTTFADTVNSSDGVLSLREAISAANESTGKVIHAPAGTYQLTWIVCGGAENNNDCGDLDIKAPMTIIGDGMGVTVIDAFPSYERGFNLLSMTGTVTLEDLSVVNAYTYSDGAGILIEGTQYVVMNDVELYHNISRTSYQGGGVNISGMANVTLNECNIHGNQAQHGGGIYNSGGILALFDTEVMDNQALYASSSKGGGIFSTGPVSQFMIDSSTIANNSSDYTGGGIELDAGVIATTTITNSTISGNQAVWNGGGLLLKSPTNISHSTITANVTDLANTISAPLGGGIFTNGTPVHIGHTILAGNTDVGNGDSNDCLNFVTLVTSDHFNLVGSNVMCSSFNGSKDDIIGVDPGLKALGDYGGPTMTHALLWGSPARDNGDSAFMSPPYDDQRGLTRVVGGAIDIGAVEWQDYSMWLTVTKTTDTLDGECSLTDCSLREAVQAANLTHDTTVIIDLPEATYTLSRAGTYDDDNSTGDLDIKAPIKMYGTRTERSIINANGIDRVLDLHSTAGEVWLHNLSIRGGYAPSNWGGGIWVHKLMAELINTEIYDNDAGVGGGLAVEQEGGYVHLVDSLVSNNNASMLGGGMSISGNSGSRANLIIENSSIEYNTAPEMGGILIAGDANASLRSSSVDSNTATNYDTGGIGAWGSTLEIQNSTISNNYANWYGGGISTSNTSLSISQSTISGNQSNGSGAGLYLSGTTVLSNSTVANNGATSGGGGFAIASGSISVSHTILAGNNGGSGNNECYVMGGVVASGGYNLVEDTISCPSFSEGSHDVLNKPAILSPLGDYGGTVLTHALTWGSPAKDAGNPAITSPNDKDQRGYTRMVNGHIDIGAVEWQDWSADYTVNTTEDKNGPCEDTSVGDCALREALKAANATHDTTVTINLPAGTYPLTISGTYEDGTNTGDLDIRVPTLLVGDGAWQTIISASGLGDRVLEVHETAGVTMLTNISITGANETIVPGAGLSVYGADVGLENVWVYGNTGPGQDGGGIRISDGLLVMVNSSANDNAANYGGGIYCQTCTMILDHVALDGNNVTQAGAGLFANGSDVTLISTEVLYNTADNGGGSGYGGGMYLTGTGSIFKMEDSLVGYNFAQGESGGIFQNADVSATISNSTIAHNTSNGYGGGLNIRGPLTLSHSTIAFNTADGNLDGSGFGGGVLAYSSSAAITMDHTILANNVDVMTPNSADCHQWNGTVNSADFNLLENKNNCMPSGAMPGDIIGVDPMLSSLADNGGEFMTCALQKGSPAIDAGDPAFVGPPTFDQRGEGFSRVVNGRIDIGAYEFPLWIYLPLIFGN